MILNKWYKTFQRIDFVLLFVARITVVNSAAPWLVLLCCVAVFTTDTSKLEGDNCPPFIETEDIVGC